MDNYLINKIGIITNTEDILLAIKVYDEVKACKNHIHMLVSIPLKNRHFWCKGYYDTQK